MAILQCIYVMTLTKFMARSTWVAHAFEWEKLLKCHLKGKTSKKLANGQNIDYSEKRKRPKGFICPCTGVKYHNIQTCLLVYAADSGERLQDHWFSGTIDEINKYSRKITEIGGGIPMEMFISQQPKATESRNWCQMIALTIFYKLVLRYINKLTFLLLKHLRKLQI